MSGYTQTIELLHSVHSHLLDQTDKDGVSFLFHVYKFVNALDFYDDIEHSSPFGNDGKQTKRHSSSPINELQIGL